MNTKRVRKSETNKEMPQVFRIGIIVILAAAILVSAFLKYYNSYMDNILYAERLNQMKEVTGQLFSGLEDVVNNWWEDAEIYYNFAEHEKPATAEQLTDFLKEQTRLNELEERRSDIIAVDSRGIYYTRNGRQGILAEVSYLLDMPERVSFISEAVTKDEAKMYFLKKMAEPITIEDESKTTTLIYYGFACSMEELDPYFLCDAYDGNNTVYVLDRNGAKLFAGKNDEVLSGYNLFNVLGKMEYLHGSSLDEAREELSRNGVSYSNAMLNNREYYYSLYQMKDAEWILLFLIPSDYVAVNTVQMMNTTVCLIMIFAVSLLVFCVIIIYWLLRKKQKQEIAAERKMNQKLELLNQKLEEAAERAEEASKAKTDFLANMSHDIRTPMNAIVGITSLMEHEEGISDKLRGYIEKVQLSSRHLLGLINDILDMSRIEAKEVKLNEERFCLAEQIDQIDSIIRAQINERRQNFHIYINGIVHEYLIGDGIRLRQILLNLLSNAVKYTPEGGDITLNFQEEACDLPDHAKFICTVSDNGYGMSPEFLKHIFEPFTRAENSVTNKVQGTGLGMAITKNIVTLMGGEIHVTSEIGKGTCFEVVLTLPIDKEISYQYEIGNVLLISEDKRLIRNAEASVRETQTEISCVPMEKAAGWLAWNRVDVILLTGEFKGTALKETAAMLRTAAQSPVLIFYVRDICAEPKDELQKESGIDGSIVRPFFLSKLEAAVSAAETQSPYAAEERNIGSILKGMHFLCAEDNELNSEILKEILNMCGAECTVYPNGAKITEAFETVKAGDYDAVLMDVQMPVMNGLDAARAIRHSKNPLGKTIPIIAMTANAFSEDVQHCLEAGMNAHIAKPIDIELLEKTLQNIAGGGK